MAQDHTKLIPAYQLNPDQVEEFLWKILPEVYKNEVYARRLGASDVDRLRKFLLSVDSTISEFKVLIDEFLNWLDPWSCPYKLLPYLAPIVGIEFNYDIPEQYARAEIERAIYIWQRKGSVDNIVDVVSILTGYHNHIREFYSNILRTNVYGDAYPENVTPPNYEKHTTNTWAGKLSFSTAKSYGIYGDGWLLREHIGIYLDIYEDSLLHEWFNRPEYLVILEKLDRALQDIILYGVTYDLIWRLLYDEKKELEYSTEEVFSGTIQVPDLEDNIYSYWGFVTNDETCHTNNNPVDYKATYGNIFKGVDWQKDDVITQPGVDPVIIPAENTTIEAFYELLFAQKFS